MRATTANTAPVKAASPEKVSQLSAQFSAMRSSLSRPAHSTVRAAMSNSDAQGAPSRVAACEVSRCGVCECSVDVIVAFLLASACGQPKPVLDERNASSDSDGRAASFGSDIGSSRCPTPQRAANDSMGNPPRQVLGAIFLMEAS